MDEELADAKHESRLRVVGCRLAILQMIARDFPELTCAEYNLVLVDLLHSSLARIHYPRPKRKVKKDGLD